jgi:hypothetical protein
MRGEVKFRKAKVETARRPGILRSAKLITKCHPDFQLYL